METQLVCIIIYLLSQHPGFSSIPSIALQQFSMTEVCMCLFACLKRAKGRSWTRGALPASMGEEKHAGKGETEKGIDGGFF